MQTTDGRMSPPQQRAVVEPASRWWKLFGPAEADGNIIDDPFQDIPNFIPEELFGGDPPGDTPLSRSVEDGGRLLMCGRQGGRLELWPLFDDEVATGTIQVFGFDWCRVPDVDNTDEDVSDASRYFVYPSLTEKNLALCFAYPLTRDDDLAPQTFAISSNQGEVHQAEFKGFRPIFSPFGQVYSSGTRYILNTAGAYCVMVWVPTLTLGNLIVLGRLV